ncbi:MAG: arginine--tRNA ligase [Myxococcales bacterium]|nr:arginine--tRNA ligase [Myxococcales bacterium]
MSASVVERVRASLGVALHGLAAKGALGDDAASKLAAPQGASPFSVERPKRPEHGDFATNIAMVFAKRLGMAPRALAELLQRELASQGGVIASAEIAGPGFINLRLAPSAFHEALASILAAGVGYGRMPSGVGERVNLEFVSANPTGPINVASGRNAIFGDAVGRLLEASGARVTREYYINDFGNQVRLFADSVAAAARGEPTPENGYQGEYVGELGLFLKAHYPETLADPEALCRTCITWMLRGIDGSKSMPGIRRTLALHRRELRRLVQRGVAPSLGRRSRRALAAGARRLPAQEGRGGLFHGEGSPKAGPVQGRRGVGHDSRRRQGSRCAEVGRGLHLFRERHRVPRRQDWPRLRPAHHGPRRRSPRLRGPRQKRAHGARFAERSLRGLALPARLHLPRWCRRQILQARRHLRDHRGGRRRDRRGGGTPWCRQRCASVLLLASHGQLERGFRHRPRQKEEPR